MNDAEEERDVVRAIARLHAGVLATVGALLGGGGVFVMTAWLLVKGGPNVGAHLQLLNQYFYGYSVTWAGCFVGLLYGAVAGAAIGWCIGAIYNLVVGIRE
jgi:hypothetical protein